MSDDEDYMSDVFLTKASNDDVRPGLLHSHKQKREHELWKKRGEKGKELEEKRKRPNLEAESRAEGLKKPIAEDNKGFAMLAKMGFNPGAGLGRHGQGLKEPINVVVKADKQGLGRESAVREVLERQRELQARKLKALSVDNFRASMSGKIQEKLARSDLRKSQEACYRMDLEWGVETPDMSWFWPEFAQKKQTDNEDEEGSDEDDEQEEEEEEEDEEEHQLTPEDKLELLTVYLRRNHLYCVWCGVKYEDEDDIRDCPGPTRCDHDE